MADGAHTPKRLSLSEFLDWEERQPHKYELLDGVVKMMAGATNAHNIVAGNVFAELWNRLSGKPCRPCNSDTKVITELGESCYPDVTVDCGPFEPEKTAATGPTIIFEVLSPSTRGDDLSIKLPAYQATPSIRQIVYLEPSRVHLTVWRRGAEGWEESEIEDREAALELDGLGFAIPVAAFYRGVLG